MDIKEVEEMMKNYHEQEDNFLKTGENTALIEKEKEIEEKKDELKNDTPDVNLLKEEIEREKLGLKRNDLHTQRLEAEMKEVLASTDMDSTLKSKLEKEYQEKINKNQEEKQEISKKISQLQKDRRNAKAVQNEKVNEELEKLENEKQDMVTEKKQNERELREKIYRKVNDLQDETRKQLTQYKKQAEDRANELELLFQAKMLQIKGFSYVYDENGNPTNGEENGKMQEDVNALIQEKYKCLDAANKCDEYCNALVTPFKMPPELPDDKIYTGEFVIEQEREAEDEVVDEIKDEIEPGLETETEHEVETKVEPETELKPELESDTQLEPPSKPKPEPKYEIQEIKEPKTASKLDIEKDLKDVGNHSNKAIEMPKVIIGRKGKIIVNGKEFTVSSKDIKKGAKLNYDEKLEILTKNPLCREFLKDKKEEEIKNYVSNLDGAVLIAIDEVGKQIDATYRNHEITVEFLMTRYLEAMDNAKNGKKHEVDIEYDLDDLSKANVLSRIFRREVNEQDKLSIRKYAKKYERYGIAEQKGEYKGPDFVTRLVSKITGKSTKDYLLPTREDEEMAAWMYNKVQTEGLEDKLEKSTPNERKQFVKNLEAKVEVKLKNGDRLIEGPGGNLENDVQYNEFNELVESQKKQDDEYYVDDKDDDKSR